MRIKKALSIIVTAVMACALSGCFLFEPTKLNTTLTTELSDSPVVSVCFFTMDSTTEAGYLVEELPADQLDSFLADINSYELVKHSGHVDYFWGGQFGIEMELEDGTYLRYDGTELEHSNASFVDDPSNKDQIKDEFIEVSSVDFWDEMKDYFPAVGDAKIRTGY